MNIMETDRHESSRQLVSSPSPHVVNVKRQPTHGYVIYLFLFHISGHGEWLLYSLRRVASLRCFGYWFAGVVYSVFNAIARRFWWGLDGAKRWVGERESFRDTAYNYVQILLTIIFTNKYIQNIVIKQKIYTDYY